MPDVPPELKIVPYNPLTSKHLGESVRRALLEQPCYDLGNLPQFDGAGVYAIYYRGNSRYYAPISERNQERCEAPIYVGRAVPPGSRKGIDVGTAGRALYNRLRQHAESIRQVSNPGSPGHLDLNDFKCRFLVVEEVWIPLIESLSITGFKPPWNGCIDGFGHHDQGATRRNQERSLWDTLHPGRPWARHFKPNRLSLDEIEDLLRRYYTDPTARPARARRVPGGREDAGSTDAAARS
jgi:hypothetical protein